MADNLKEKVKNVFNQFGLFILSTSESNTPRSRYMSGLMRDDLSIRGVTNLSSQKVSTIRNNPNVCCLCAIDPTKFDSPTVIISGKASILDDPEIKRDYWGDGLKRFFTGPDDPDYAVYRISPVRVEYYAPFALKPEVIEV
jgi:general stress protein 26